MVKRKSRRVRVTSAKKDIISNLPEHLIDHILKKLPLDDAVKTSVLSTKWRYRYTTMRKLIISEQFSEKFSTIGAYEHNGFVRVIDQIMMNHKGPMLKFYLYIPDIVLDSFEEVDQWMLILPGKGVRVLTIASTNQIYPIPSCIFSCLELRKFGLLNCIFKQPSGFQGFPNLEDIHFVRVDFGGNLGGNVINLPHLEELTMVKCRNVNNFNIKAEKLRFLWVIGCPDAMLPRLLHSECLRVFRICFLKPMEDFPRVERINLPTMLSHLPNIQILTIDGYFLKFLAAEKFPKWLPQEVKCLQKLEFQNLSFGDLDQVQGALCMLRNSPNLEVLRVTHMEMMPEDDLELTSNYLLSSICWPWKLLKLETVEMASLEGSRPELFFTMLLLHISPNLECMIIQPTANADAEKRLNIAKDVMVIPRASANAKIVYMDPEP